MSTNETNNREKDNDQNKKETQKNQLVTKSYLEEKRHQKFEITKKHVIDWRMKHRVIKYFFL
mgnify:CR=1 FL=1